MKPKVVEYDENGRRMGGGGTQPATRRMLSKDSRAQSEMLKIVDQAPHYKSGSKGDLSANLTIDENVAGR